ncbi:hypothetical protein ACP4OV_009108 [Aristida adscensionis]
MTARSGGGGAASGEERSAGALSRPSAAVGRSQRAATAGASTPAAAEASPEALLAEVTRAEGVAARRRSLLRLVAAGGAGAEASPEALLAEVARAEGDAARRTSLLRLVAAGGAGAREEAAASSLLHRRTGVVAMAANVAQHSVRFDEPMVFYNTLEVQSTEIEDLIDSLLILFESIAFVRKRLYEMVCKVSVVNDPLSLGKEMCEASKDVNDLLKIAEESEAQIKAMGGLCVKIPVHFYEDVKPKKI